MDNEYYSEFENALNIETAGYALNIGVANRFEYLDDYVLVKIA